MPETKEINEEELYRQAVEAWGEWFQLGMVVEECAELIHAVMRKLRGKKSTWNLTDEGVDVEIMLGQLKVMLNNETLWKQRKQEKLERLKRLLEKKE